MSKKSKNRKSKSAETQKSPAEVGIAIVVPLLGSLLLGQAVAAITGASSESLSRSSIILAGLGIISMYYGMQKYGTPGMGLRGGRPMFAGAGFAFMGWVAVIVLRFIYIAVDENALNQPLFSVFTYLLLFEAFALQVWAFSLIFKAVSNVYGGLTAAIVSGLAFAGTGFYFFQESFFLNQVFTSGWLIVVGILYMAAWGVFYGMVRLRTGSILGIVLVQAMQSLTTWELIPPFEFVNESNLNPLFYSLAGIIYAVLIWRLWPKELDDYRI